MLAGLCYTLAVTAVLSHGRVFWEDEMLGWMLLRDPSWHHMLRAYNLGADGGGFTFYLLGRGWLTLFGPSELSFRLFSSTCFGLAFAVSWAALRRFYGVGLIAFALFNTWFFSPPFVAHMAEGRFYGLLVLAVSLAFWLTLRLADDPQPTPARLYLATFLIHALLTTTHLLGIVFSAFLLGATLALDLLAHRPRPRLYLIGAAAWLLLLPEHANIAATMRVGKPHFWTRPPKLFDGLLLYAGSSKEIALVLLVLAAAVLWRLLRTPHPRSVLQQAWTARQPIYVVTAAFLLVPLAFLLQGLVGTWLLNDRYLLPLTVAVAYLTAELAQLALPARPAPAPRWWPVLRWAAGTVFVAAMLFWDLKHLASFSESQPDYTAALTARLPHDLPVVCEDGKTFMELIGRQHDSGVHYVFLLDWQQSLSPSAPRVEVTQYHLLENWRKAGYFSGSIEPIDQFLREHDRFLVLHAGPAIPNTLPPEIGNPLAERLAHDPAFEVRPYTTLTHAKQQDTVFLVCKGSQCLDR